MWLSLLYLVMLINFGVVNPLEFKFKSKWIRKNFNLKDFAGVWFEAGVYHMVIPSDRGCNTWKFEMDGNNVMNVTYYTNGEESGNELEYGGRLRLKNTAKVFKPGRPIYEIDLVPSRKEFWFGNTQYLDWAVIDTDYDLYAFVYVARRDSWFGDEESIIALSRHYSYAIYFKRYFMQYYIPKFFKFKYNNFLCIPKLLDESRSEHNIHFIKTNIDTEEFEDQNETKDYDKTKNQNQ